MAISNVFIPLVLVLCSNGLSSTDFVFGKYINQTGFDDRNGSNLAYIVIIGALMTPLTISCFEGAATLSEETVQGHEAAPRNMIKAVAFSVLGGFIMLISLLLSCREEYESILAGPSQEPALNIFALAFTR